MTQRREKWARFRVGEAFPADCVLARWIVGLATIANDLIQVNALLLNGARCAGDSLRPEAIFGFWLASSQYREAAKFLQAGWQHPEVAQFTNGLGPETQQHWDRVRSSFEPWKGSFVERVMKPLRDSLLHYPMPGDVRWEEALKEVALQESGLRFLGTEEVRDTRAVFADEARCALLSASLGADATEIGHSVAKVADLICELISFAHESLFAYLMNLPAGVVRVQEHDSPA